MNDVTRLAGEAIELDVSTVVHGVNILYILPYIKASCKLSST